MSISLTEDEFTERFRARQKLLRVAMSEDIASLTSTTVGSQMAEMVLKTLRRVITLVYSEDLD